MKACEFFWTFFNPYFPATTSIIGFAPSLGTPMHLLTTLGYLFQSLHFFLQYLYATNFSMQCNMHITLPHMQPMLLMEAMSPLYYTPYTNMPTQQCCSSIHGSPTITFAAIWLCVATTIHTTRVTLVPPITPVHQTPPLLILTKRLYSQLIHLNPFLLCHQMHPFSCQRKSWHWSC